MSDWNEQLHEHTKTMKGAAERAVQRHRTAVQNQAQVLKWAHCPPDPTPCTPSHPLYGP